MQFDHAYLDLWAETLFLLNCVLLHLTSAVSREKVSIDIIATLQFARKLNTRALDSILSAGANDPLLADLSWPDRFDARAPWDTIRSNTLILGPPPTTLLDSRSNRMFLEALRMAHYAGRLVDEERGAWAEGWTEILGSFVALVEREISTAEEGNRICF